LTAKEWKDFLSFINAARANAGDSAISFDTSDVTSGRPFTAQMFTAARNAIASATGHGTLPNNASSGGVIYGTAHFGRARDSINAVANQEILED